MQLQETLCSFYDELRSLPVKMRDAIVLVHLEGRSRAEAAEALECTQSALKARLVHGRKALRNRLVRRGVVLTLALKLAAYDQQALAVCDAELFNSTVVLATEFGATVTSSASSYNATPSLSVANEGVRKMFLHSAMRHGFAISGAIAFIALFI